MPANKLSLNVVKNEYFKYCSNYELPQSTFPLNENKMGNDSMNRVSRQRVYIDEHLQWCSDVDHFANKILSGLAGLKEVKLPRPCTVIYSKGNVVGTR